MPRNRGKKTQFGESALLNNRTYNYYIDRIAELSVSMFEWKNLPDTIDQRYLEMCLFKNGCAVYFNDEVMGNLCLSCCQQGNFDVYGNPIRRRAYSHYNNYQKNLDQSDSVIIWNNYLHTNSIATVKIYARRLYNLDRIIDVNANAQKTPILLQGTEQQRLTLLNLYKQYDGNEPFIFGDKNLDLNSLKSISTQAPYISDKINELKTALWNELLTVLGISNINVQKKERLITDEVVRNQGGTIASRYSRLECRRVAVEKINAMFGTNIEVNYREDFQQVTDDNELGKDTITEEPGMDTIGEPGNE